MAPPWELGGWSHLMGKRSPLPTPCPVASCPFPTACSILIFFSFSDAGFDLNTMILNKKEWISLCSLWILPSIVLWTHWSWIFPTILTQQPTSWAKNNQILSLFFSTKMFLGHSYALSSLGALFLSTWEKWTRSLQWLSVGTRASTMHSPAFGDLFKLHKEGKAAALLPCT